MQSAVQAIVNDNEAKERKRFNDYKALAEAGYEIKHIAKILGVHFSTAWRNLIKYNLLEVQNKAYQKNVAAAMEIDVLENLDLQRKIRNTLDDSSISQMSEDKKAGWYRALTVDSGVKIDKSRLYRGESTSIVDISRADGLRKEIQELNRMIEMEEGKDYTVTVDK